MTLSHGPGTGSDRHNNDIASLRTVNRRGGKGDIPAEFMSRHADVLSRAASLAIGSGRRFAPDARATLHVQAHGGTRRFGGPHAETFEVIIQVGGSIFSIGRIEGDTFVTSALLSSGRKESRHATGPMGPDMDTAVEPAQIGLSREDLSLLTSLVKHLALDPEKPVVAAPVPQKPAAADIRRGFADVFARLLA